MKESKEKNRENGAIQSPAPLSAKDSVPSKDDIARLTDKQAREALSIVTGISNRNPTSEKVRAFVLSKAPRASERMVELSEQVENATVAFNATRDILDRAGIGISKTPEDTSQHFIGEDEAILILRRRFQN